MSIELHGTSFYRGTLHPSVVSPVIPNVDVIEFMDAVVFCDHTILNLSSALMQRIFLHS